MESVKKQYKYYHFHIHKILRKKYNKKYSIDASSRNQLNSILIYITEKICEKSRWFVQKNKKKTLSISDIQQSLYMICYPNEIYQNMIEFAGMCTREDIIFPPSISIRFLRNSGYSNICITATSSIFLTRCMQYIYEYLLEESIKHIQTNRIYMPNIQKGIENNIFLQHICNQLHIQCYVPYTRPIVPYSILEKYIRSLTNPHTLKVSKKVFLIIQFYIETYITGLLDKAKLISNSSTILPRHIYHVLSILHIKYPVSYRIEFVDSEIIL